MSQNYPILSEVVFYIYIYRPVGFTALTLGNVSQIDRRSSLVKICHCFFIVPT
jgi:hypothetical protein